MKECDPKKMDASMYGVILVNLNTLIDSVERDEELCQILKKARKHVVNKIQSLIYNVLIDKEHHRKSTLVYWNPDITLALIDYRFYILKI
jgi:hypothetical protein